MDLAAQYFVRNKITRMDIISVTRPLDQEFVTSIGMDLVVMFIAKKSKVSIIHVTM